MIINRYSEINKTDTTLRPYQQKAKKEIFESWDEVDSVMFQMPTGTGKTRLFTSIIRDINDYSLRRREAVKILIVAHRTELIKQIDQHLERYAVPHNVIAGGKDKNFKKPVNVASIQTITHPSNLKDAKKLNVQFVIIDEAHHALAASYRKLWEMYPKAKRLGVTATPWRMNHQSFTNLFDKLVLSMPIKDFIRQGFLAPYKYYSLKNDSDIQKTIDGIELDKFGEYQEASMEEKMDIGSIRAQLLDSYLSLAEGKKGIIYAINIAHARHICKEYEGAGYRAVSIDSKTPAKQREELVEKFQKSEIDIIVNVDIFSEGFDCPDIEFIQLARPTRSLVKYLQQVGRGLRHTENKQNCVILDNVGMYSRFGLPDARRHWKQHFLGKKVDEEPKRVLSNGTGRSRNVDLSEGTEDMELIQDVEDIVEATETTIETPTDPIETTPTVMDDFFPLFGFTLGKTTWEHAEEMGHEVEIWEKGPSRTTRVEDVDFWDHEGEGVFTSLYWTKYDRDFPASWKSKGFSWELSFDEWRYLFKELGFSLVLTQQPVSKKYSKRNTLSAKFEAKSSDGELLFALHFDYGEDGYYTSSPNTLYSITVDYNGQIQNDYRETDETESHTDIETDEEVENTDVFDPIPLLEANNYKDDNFIFWFMDTEQVYEAYIQNDTHFVISELIIDEPRHCVYRLRVGKISADSWMFEQMLKEDVRQLQSIQHFEANYTVFHYQEQLPDNSIRDRYFDYKGKEIGSPDVVKGKYDSAKKSDGRLDDYIDVPVSKAWFGVEFLRKSSSISVTRTLQGTTKIIAIFNLLSDFGRKYYGLKGKAAQANGKYKVKDSDFKK